MFDENSFFTLVKSETIGTGITAGIYAGKVDGKFDFLSLEDKSQH